MYNEVEKAHGLPHWLTCTLEKFSLDRCDKVARYCFDVIDGDLAPSDVDATGELSVSHAIWEIFFR